ncbi:hypothetical protein IU433_13970 [Nocardia puris]|uniref:hypothetical protein n=1 Tax=Nocardia puris TaxID=208602 RepID=UPI001894061A|nr:hypothetical protein [Nocardia puris]MBF6460143.1 hypothetical protein [Nocardia puris]
MDRLIPPPRANPAFAQEVPLTRIIKAILGGFASIADAIFNLVDNDYVSALPIINDHSQSITEMREVVDQLILQGVALKFTGNGIYTPNPNLVALDAILIGAGGGGSSGSYDALVDGTRSGGGGGGGGETHVTIPASLLPTNPDGSFKSIQIVIGMGGAGAPGDSDVGTGGGHTLLGPEVGSAAQPWLLAGGGQGGSWGNSGPIALGGIGMIPGGNGDRGLGPAGAGDGAGHSTSAFDLHGGGGGGGRGAAQGRGGGTTGGGGGVSPGGTPGNPGNAGSAPSDIVATGAGGGGGGSSGSARGGHGGFPAGGGGGAACAFGGAGAGGNGGHGVLYLIERMA